MMRANLVPVRLICITLLAIWSVPAFAEDAVTIRLDQMTQADRVAIQRGHNQADVECYEEVIDNVKRSKVPRRDTYVTFDDPEESGISVTFADTDDNYTCVDGEMRSYEMGEYTVIKRFVVE